MIAQVSDEQNEEDISSATGEPLKKHEKWGLKGLNEEQQVRFWEDVVYWSKERFSEAKWREVVRGIERAKGEDDVIVFGWRPPPQPVHLLVTTGGRRSLLYSTSSLTSPTGAHPLRPANLPRIASSTSTTPRPRWDVVPSGPVTPLSSTSGSVKNAFAEGGFWASLTPKTSFTAVPVSTPTTAVNLDQWAPETPKAPEAKAAYDQIKKEVNKTALQLCASRLALQRSSNGEGDVIHPSMVKPKDKLQAAELILESRQLDLSKHLDPNFPDAIDHSADDDAACLRQNNISTSETLADIDTWLQFDNETGSLTNILEAQRDLFRTTRERRKSKEKQLSEQAVQLAWAVKIVDDAEYLVESRADAESAGSDEDQGYDYGNFVRSLRSQTDKDLRGDTEQPVYDKFGSLQASSTTNHHAQIRTSGRSSSSPVKPKHAPPSSYNSTLPLRADNHFSSTASHPRNPRAHRKNLSIVTTGVPAPHLPSVANPAMSPEERGFRHQGPSIEDLSTWADELRTMERKRAEMKLNGNGRMDAVGHRKGVSSSTTATTTTGTGDGSSKKRWGRSEKRAGRAEGVIHVNGSIRPAFRTDYTFPTETEVGLGLGISAGDPADEMGKQDETESARSSISSDSSWVCETAAEVERSAPLYTSAEPNITATAHDDNNNTEGDTKIPTTYFENHNSRSSFRLSPPRYPFLLPVAPSTSTLAPYNRLAPTSLERRAASAACRWSTRQEEQEWARELARMEEVERVRQRGVGERGRERERERERGGE